MADWITTTEAVKISGYSAYHLRYLIRQGKIAARKFGAVWQVDRLSLLTYIDAARKSEDKRHGPKSD